MMTERWIENFLRAYYGERAKKIVFAFSKKEVEVTTEGGRVIKLRYDPVANTVEVIEGDNGWLLEEPHLFGEVRL